ncbi:ribonuclease T [Jiella sp. MQZ9-1]|uniref:Ribonuclease T n=1 Tax=Jiella flava TaxID=2816857 RepID=A0A939JSI7_9HYPH|nr:ribonuclease T [Jiella flava]MBO0663003.1 ribonuclease T [Jiella flava]MCD2471238.1 ribonuclease T [Jiella flava]
MRWSLGAAGPAALFLATAAPAQQPLEGFVIARKACDATTEIRGGGKSDGTRLEINHAYGLLGENKAQGRYYAVVVPDADPPRRWIAKDCGDWVKLVTEGKGAADPGEIVAVEGAPQASGKVPTAPTAAGGGSTAGAPATAAEAGPMTAAGSSSATSVSPAKTAMGSKDGASQKPHTAFVFAISWQPAFCEGHHGKAECASQTPQRFDASHFSLHGLWPQPRSRSYCGVSASLKAAADSGQWGKLPAVDLSSATRDALKVAMPGTQSGLEKHEWLKHGTCYGKSAEDYFEDSLTILDQINRSVVRDLFAHAIGKTLTRGQIRKAFDEAFGDGAGERVRVACTGRRDRRLIGELTIGLSGHISSVPDLAALIAAARPTDGGCDQGIVDPVGFQSSDAK